MKASRTTNDSVVRHLPEREQIQIKIATDDSISSQIRIALNELQKKYGDKFSLRSKELVKQLLKKTNRYSNLQVNETLKKMMVNVEPVWFNPVLDMRATTEPLSRRYYMPTWFKLANGSLIHHSWVIFNCYSEVSDILKPTYYFGGIPLPQLLYEQVYAAHRSAKEAPNLLQSKRLNYMSGAPLQALADDEEGIWDRAAYAFTKFRNNYGVLVTQEGQQIGQIDTGLTDVDSVTMLSYQIVAAISGIPSAKLLETSPKGWQSSGSYEDDNYRKLQLSIQTDDYIPILEMHYRLLHKSMYGDDKEFCIVFDPIDVPSEKERAEIREINARTDSTYIQAGVLSPEEVRGVLRQDENSGYDTLEEEMQGNEPDVFGEENGTESLNELVNDPTISASEAATLNGVQVTSMVNIASQVAKNELSRESAIAILQKSFNMSEQEAESIIGNEKLNSLLLMIK